MNTTLKLYIAVGFGGMVGSSLRYSFSLMFEQNNGSAFPWATLFINLSGAFLLTFLLYLPIIVQKMQQVLLTSLTTGVIGSYTTFSTIQLEIVTLLETHLLQAILYLSCTVILGLLFSYLGYRVANWLLVKGAKY